MKPKRHKWTIAEIHQLATLATQGMKVAEIAERMDFSYTQITNAMCRYRITNGHRNFKKGNTPWNAGTKGKCKPNSGSFKKGIKPANTLPEDIIQIWNYNGGKQTKMIKTKNGWLPLHRHAWQLVFGNIPPGHRIAFKDGDQLNCELSNLELISDAENVRRNHDPKKTGESLRKAHEVDRIRKMYGLRPKIKPRKKSKQ